MIEHKKKEFTFRGKKIEELKQLDIRDFANLLKSRERRTVLRNFQKIENFINRAKRKLEKKKPIRTHNRNIIVTPQMIGWKIFVYNGRDFVPIQIIEEMLGHRFGEFSMTRARIKHSKSGVGATKSSKAKTRK